MGHANPAALFTLETAEALTEFYGDGPIPAAEIHLVEALFLDRYLSHQLETHLGERGLFVKKGDDPHGALHPAVNAAIRARGRYGKLMRDLAKRHGKAQTTARATSRNTATTPPTAGHVPFQPSPIPPAPNGHAAAQSSRLDPATETQAPPPAFMNRAMRRSAAKEAKSARGQSQP